MQCPGTAGNIMIPCGITLPSGYILLEDNVFPRGITLLNDSLAVRDEALPDQAYVVAAGGSLPGSITLPSGIKFPVGITLPSVTTLPAG